MSVRRSVRFATLANEVLLAVGLVVVIAVLLALGLVAVIANVVGFVVRLTLDFTDAIVVAIEDVVRRVQVRRKNAKEQP